MIRSAAGEGRALTEFFHSVYWPRKSKGRSPNNLRLYKNALANLDLYLGRTALLTDLDDELIAAWLPWFIERGRNEETANKNLRHILALWRFAARKRFVEEFPDVGFLPTVERMPKAWLRDELNQLFELAGQQPGQMAGVHAGYWWKALLWVLWFGGERIYATLHLRWEDFDSKNCCILSRAEYRKGRKKDKLLHIPAHVMKHVAALRVYHKQEWIFDWKKEWGYWTSIYHPYKQLLAKAGLPTGRDSMFHRVRKSHASYLDAKGGDATKSLDHTNGAITKKYYIDPRVSDGAKASDLLFDPTSDPSKKE